MPKTNTPEQLFEQAVEAFPYPHLQPTSITMGELPDKLANAEIEYAEEFTFEAGTLLGDELTAGGWIELRQDGGDDEPTITAFFGVARNGDWKAGSVLPETMALQGQYDLNTQTWDLYIDHY